MKKIIITLVCISSIILGCTALYVYNKSLPDKTYIASGLVRTKTVSDLIIDSDLIIRGKVDKSLDSKWSNPNLVRGKHIRNIITTDFIIKIDEVYKGTPYDNKNVAIRIGKGTVGKERLISNGYPDFDTNEQVLLFLSKDDSDIATNENYYVLTGMRQGKFKFKNKLEYVNESYTIKISEFRGLISKYLDYAQKYPKQKMTKEEIKKINEKAFGPDEITTNNEVINSHIPLEEDKPDPKYHSPDLSTKKDGSVIKDKDKE